jgi:pimeloyl-ACP methyl ester carboxylesterase
MKLFDHKSGRITKIGEAEIYIEEIGEANEEALFLLHGGFGTMEDFNGILPLLEKPYHIIGMDSCGHGKSTLGGKKLTYERLQEDVEAICKELKLKEISIIGLSDGGVVGYRLACLSKLKIKKLVTIGARWNFSNAEETKEILASTTPKKWKAKFPETFKTYKSLNPAPNFDKLTLALVNMWLDFNDSGYPNEKVKSIKCPSLVIRGDEDHLVKRKFVFNLVEHLKSAQFLNIPFAGHAVLNDQKSIAMETINQFLKQ